MTPKEIATAAAHAAADIKAEDLIVLDLGALTSFTDFFVICSGNSNRQVQAIADSISKQLKIKKQNFLGIEGYAEGQWILIDFGSVVVHVFYREVRSYYNLEKLWSDAKPLRVRGLTESARAAAS